MKPQNNAITTSVNNNHVIKKIRVVSIVQYLCRGKKACKSYALKRKGTVTSVSKCWLNHRYTTVTG